MSDDSSDCSDIEDMRNSMLQRLTSYLDEQMGEEPSRKKKKAKPIADTTEIREYEDETVSVKTVQEETDSLNLAKIKRLTSDAKRVKTHAALKSQDKDKIKNKMKLILSQPQVEEPDGESPHERDDFSDEQNSVEESSDGFGDGFSDDEDSGMDMASAEVKSSSHQPINKQLDKFKSALGITETDLRLAKECRERNCKMNTVSERVKTVASEKGRKRPPPDVVVFNDRKPQKSKPKVAVKENSSDSEGEEFDLKRARHEVCKFGVSGPDREAGMVDLLVKLGAKPPKKSCINYKELQEKHKQDMQAAAEKREMDGKLGFKVVNPGKKKRMRRDRNDVGGVDGQIGSYKGGVQVVGRRDIASVTKKLNKKRR